VAVFIEQLDTYNSGLDQTSYTTGSYAPNNGDLMIIGVIAARSSAIPPTPTVTGCSITWVQKFKIDFDTTGNCYTLFVFHGQKSNPSTGAITFNFGVTMLGMVAIVLRCTGALLDLAGSGATAVAGINGTYSSAGANVLTNPAVASGTPDTTSSMLMIGGAEVFETLRGMSAWNRGVQISDNSPPESIRHQWRQNRYDTSANFAWNTSAPAAAIMMEIKAAPVTQNNALYKRLIAQVTVEDRQIPFSEIHTSHSVDQPVGTCTITVPIAFDNVPSIIQENGLVQVFAGLDGYVDNTVSTIFHGRIVGIKRRYDESGWFLTLECDGWNSIMAFPQTEPVEYGPTSRTIRQVIRGLYKERGFGPIASGFNGVQYNIAEFQSPGGTTLSLGGVDHVNDGKIIIESQTSFLDWISDVCSLFRYRVYDRPDGVCAVSRVNGTPYNSLRKYTFEEGVDIFSIDRASSVNEVITWWEVNGASGTSESGNYYNYSSIPVSVPPNANIPSPPGYTYGEIQNDMLNSDLLCQAVRQAHEKDFSDLQIASTWETWLRPDIQPGDVVGVRADTMAFDSTINNNLWVTGVQHSITSEGAYTSLTLWAGTGTTLPGQENCAETEISASVYHVGDEVLSYFKNTSAAGTQVDIAFTMPAAYVQGLIKARVHSANSHMINGNKDSTPSKFQILQSSTVISEGIIPPMPNNSSADYRLDKYWRNVEVPMNGELNTGASTLRLFSGTIAGGGGRNDFEVRDIFLEHCGDVIPTLPSPHIDPVIIPKGGGCLGTATPDIALKGGRISGLEPGSFETADDVQMGVTTFTIPAGYAYIKVKGVFSDLESGGTRAAPNHRITWTSKGLVAPYLVPGTYDSGDVNSGTWMTGDGRGEFTFVISPPGTDLIVAAADIIISAIPGTTSYYCTSLCVQAFAGDPN
jgi:hypothetical protein